MGSHSHLTEGSLAQSAARFAVKQFPTPQPFSLDNHPPVPPEEQRDDVRQGAGRTGWLDGSYDLFSPSIFR